MGYFSTGAHENVIDRRHAVIYLDVALDKQLALITTRGLRRLYCMRIVES
jgi:hypothetical protein